MKQNVTPLERWIRLLLGLGILSLAFFGPQTILGYLGIIAVVSALSGFCPIYQIMGTRK